MIWIEGESTAWTYLSELELKPSLHEPLHITGPVSHSSKNEIEHKAEELRLRALTTKPHPIPKVHIEKPGEPAPPPVEIDEDTIIMVDHRKEKKYILNEVLMTGLIVALFAGGIYTSQTFLAGKKTVAKPANTKLVTTEEHAAKLVQDEDLALTQQLVQQDTTVIADSSKPSISLANTIRKQLPKTLDTQSMVQKPAAAPVEPLVIPPKPEPVVETPPKLNAEETASKAREEAVTDKKEAKPEEEPKKKGFLKNLFKKKKKDDDPSSKEKNNTEDDQ